MSESMGYVFAALFVASFFAAYKFQWQALYFMMAVGYGTFTVQMSWALFFTLSIFLVVVCMFAGFLNGTLKMGRSG